MMSMTSVDPVRASKVTLAVAEALNPNKPKPILQGESYADILNCIVVVLKYTNLCTFNTTTLVTPLISNT